MTAYIVVIGLTSRLAAVVVVALALAGCYGGDESDDLVTRETLVQAFEEAGEPVALEIDMAVADPDSPIDAYYVPAKEGALRSFGLVLLEDREAAVEHEVSVRAITFDQMELARQRNVFLAMHPNMGIARRDRLVAVLESL